VSKEHNPLFWGAVHLHRVLERRVQHGLGLRQLESSGLLDRQQTVQHIWDRLVSAQSRGWRLAAGRLHEQLHSQIRLLHLLTGELLDRADVPRPLVPSLPELLADLRQLADEFEHVEVLPKTKMLVAETSPIELEGLSLGRFSIQLHLDRLDGSLGTRCFDCVALGPNPAAGNDSVTHPHVQSKALCAGDATVPIATALAQGRITDAFCLIRAVLQTYNPSSPYVSIEEWDGTRCTDCDDLVRSDRVNHCDGCGSDFCDDCFSFCDLCEQSYCSSCLEHDRVSDNRCCSTCRHTCSDCGRTVDSDSFNDETNLCPGCDSEHHEQEDVSEPPLQENDHDSIPEIPDPQVAVAA